MTILSVVDVDLGIPVSETYDTASETQGTFKDFKRSMTVVFNGTKVTGSLASGEVTEAVSVTLLKDRSQSR